MCLRRCEHEKRSRWYKPDTYLPRTATLEDLQSVINSQTLETSSTQRLVCFLGRGSRHILANGTVFFSSAPTDFVLTSICPRWRRGEKPQRSRVLEQYNVCEESCVSVSIHMCVLQEWKRKRWGRWPVRTAASGLISSAERERQDVKIQHRAVKTTGSSSRQLDFHSADCVARLPALHAHWNNINRWVKCNTPKAQNSCELWMLLPEDQHYRRKFII